MADNAPPQPPESDHLTDENRVTTDDSAGAEDRSFQTKPGDVEAVDENLGAQGWPLKVSVGNLDRSREQGLGVGQAELDAQDDPSQAFSTDRYAGDDPAKGADADEADMANDPDPKDAKS